MTKKVVIDPEDFEKLVLYITRQPVNFQYADKAGEVKAIIARAQIMDIDIKEKGAKV